MECLKLDRDMEEMERNHKVEIRVYLQKVKHLEFEHEHNENDVESEKKHNIDEENESHQQRIEKLKRKKASLKLELIERQCQNEQEVKELNENNKKNMEKLNKHFSDTLTGLEKMYADKLETLKNELELKRKVEIHEIEERKNLHINQLMKNHEKSFNQIKSYYNEITKDNLSLINSLKDAIVQLEEKAEANQKLMYEIAQENKRLSGPLKLTLKELSQLQAALKNYNGDKLVLHNVTARLKAADERLKTLKIEHENLLQLYSDTEKERDELYDRFENTVSAVERKTDLKNLVLEKRIEKLNHDYDVKEVQLRDTLAAANIDPATLNAITIQLDDTLFQCNSIIQDLQYAVIRVIKSHNDIVRTYTEKLNEYGVPTDDCIFILFLVDVEVIGNEASRGPAGLVAQGLV